MGELQGKSTSSLAPGISTTSAWDLLSLRLESQISTTATSDDDMKEILIRLGEMETETKTS